MVDIDRLERLLVAAARERRPMTYGQLLGCFDRGVSRATVQGLCRDLGRVMRRLTPQGAPDLACLVVRRADGLPGEGWFHFAREELGYIGAGTGPGAVAFLAACQRRAYAWAAALPGGDTLPGGEALQSFSEERTTRGQAHE